MLYHCHCLLSLLPCPILSYSALPSSSLPYHIPSCPVLFFWLNPILEFYHPVKSCILSSSTHFSVISQYRHLSLIFFSQYLFFIPFSPSSPPTPSISISSSSSSSSSSPSSSSSSPSSSAFAPILARHIISCMSYSILFLNTVPLMVYLSLLLS